MYELICICRKRSRRWLPLLSVTLLFLSGCGGNHKSTPSLPQFESLYSFGGASVTGQVAVLPDGTVDAITAIKPVDLNSRIYNNLTQYSKYGLGSPLTVQSDFPFGLSNDQHVVVSPFNGNIYAPAPSGSTYPIDVFSPSGQLLLTFAPPGNGETSVNFGMKYNRIAIDSKGIAYVVYLGGIAKFDPAGTPIGTIDTTASGDEPKVCIAIDSKDQLYLGGPTMVTEYTTSGVETKQFPGDGRTITAIGVDSSGNVYVGDTRMDYTPELSRYTPNGVLTTQSQLGGDFTVAPDGTVFSTFSTDDAFGFVLVLHAP